ncbi:MAG: DUF2256 and DUF3253 domain-containing protein [Acidimicrobiia bacterium]|nr:DUF2256 and DUF3253 domain-containing protein [Acidimicrobiia bacterium]
MRTQNQPSKTCATCGRRFEWRRAWKHSWDEVKYCSQRCRRSKPGHRDREIERAIVALLSERARGASICPSDVARKLAPDDWRPLMEPVRQAARRLVAAGEVEITQGGRPVDPSTARGPIRIRLRR